MVKGIDAKELLKAGGKIPQEQRRSIFQGEIDILACKIVGALADASSQEVRRRALDKARRMIGRR